MPKKIYTINSYHEGINESSNARMLGEFQLQEAQDIRVDNIGKMRPIGRGMLHDAGGINVIATKNLGLFVFSSDRQFGAAADESGENWLALGYHGIAYGASTSGVGLYYSSGDTWDMLEIGGYSIYFEPRMYYVDGVLRVSDTRFTTSNQKSSKWYGYIKRDQLGGYVSFNDWYIKDQVLTKPSEGYFSNDSSGATIWGVSDGGSSSTSVIHDTNANFETGIVGYEVYNIDDGDFSNISARGSSTTISATSALTWLNKNYLIFPETAGAGFCVGVRSKASSTLAGTWAPKQTFTVAITFIYDDVQESLPYKLSGNAFEVGTGHDTLDVTVTARGAYDARITGGRVYFKTPGGEYTLLCDISLEEGVRPELDGNYTAWSNPTGSAGYYLSEIEVKNASGNTYETINGFSSAENDVSFGTAGNGYKYALVAGNRSAYTANLRITNPDGEVVNRSDMMIKTPPNKFDTFLWGNRIEVAIDDGDEITGIEFIGDRLLQFKKNRTYVINISQNIEFLEQTHEHAGCNGQHSVCKFETGISWVNENGIFLFNGETVLDLTFDRKTGAKRLNWGTNYYSNIDDVIVGYEPKSGLIVIGLDTDELLSSDILLYHIGTDSFTYGVDKLRNPIHWAGRFEEDTDGWENVDMDGMSRNTTDPIGGDADLTFDSSVSGQYIKYPIPFELNEGFQYTVTMDYRVSSGAAFKLFIGDSAGVDWSSGADLNMVANTNTEESETFTVAIPAAATGDVGDGFLIIESVLAGATIFTDDMESYATHGEIGAAWIGSLSILLETAAPLAGAKSLKVHANTHLYTAYQAATIPIVHGTTYTVSCMTNASSNGKFEWGIVTSLPSQPGSPTYPSWFNGGVGKPCTAGSSSPSEIFTPSGFTGDCYFIIHALTGSATYNTIMDNILITSAAPNGEGWIDNVKIQPYYGGVGDYPVISNFTNDWDGKLIYALMHPSASSVQEQALICYFDPEDGSGAVPKVVTGELTFGSAENKKKAYDIIVNHKGAGDGTIAVSYRENGAGVWTSAGTLTDYSEMTREKFAVTISDMYSLEVKLEASSEVEFEWEVSNVSIVNRVLHAAF